MGTKYTLVQHSGWVAGGNPQFRDAVEEWVLDSEAQERKVKEVGGLVFDSYSSASNAADEENYPPEIKGIIPRVRGTFSTKHVRGAAIYVPPNASRIVASITRSALIGKPTLSGT